MPARGQGETEFVLQWQVHGVRDLSHLWKTILQEVTASRDSRRDALPTNCPTVRAAYRMAVESISAK